MRVLSPVVQAEDGCGSGQLGCSIAQEVARRYPSADLTTMPAAVMAARRWESVVARTRQDARSSERPWFLAIGERRGDALIHGRRLMRRSVWGLAWLGCRAR